MGFFQYPQLVTIQIGPDLVWISLNMQQRNFDLSAPQFYYASTDCSGQSYMYVDLFRLGMIGGTTLYYPAGEPAPMVYNSVKDDTGCHQYSNNGFANPDTFAPTAMMSLAQFVAPFHISQ